MTPLISSVCLAVAVITSPDLPADFKPDELTLSAIRQVAVSWEILDPREQKYLFVNLVDLTPDLKILRNRYAQLKNVPPACDADRFPDRQLCNELIGMNHAYKKFMEDRERLGQSLAGEDIKEIISECNALHAIWDTVRDAKCDYYYVTVRREALKKLRDQIGVVNYYGGFLPPHVPVWRFPRN